MEKKKSKKRRRLFGINIGELSAVVTLFITLAASLVACVQYFDRKFDGIDRRFESVDRRFETIDRKFETMDHKFEARFDSIETRFDSIDGRLNRIEGDLKTTSDLLNVYLTWRFLYVNDPTRKSLTPRYDPTSRTLEFVDKNNRVIK